MSDGRISEIRSDIEDTRLEMGETLHELGDRLDPAHLVNEAKTNISDTARGTSHMVIDTIKKNPIPTAMAAGGLALLVMNRSHSSHDGNGRGEYYSPMYGTTTGSAQRAGAEHGSTSGGSGQSGGPSIANRASGAADDARGRIDEAGQMVGQRVDQAGQMVGQRVDQAGQMVGDVTHQASSRFEEIMRSNPLAVGAIAIGAGAVVGALVPETPQEREALGGASRQVSETIRERVDESADQAESKLDQQMSKSAQSSGSASG